MKKIVLGLSALCLLMSCGSSEQPAVIKISEETLMHEVRATPSPAILLVSCGRTNSLI